MPLTLGTGPSPSSASQEVLRFLETTLPAAALRSPSTVIRGDGDGDKLPYDESVNLNIRFHLISLIEEFPSLEIKSDSFTHNDGTTVTLLQAVGTIPMYYREVQYNIPVTIWLPELYPKCAPIVYVSPTRDMMIKRPHPHVDPSGFVSVDYLESWRYPRSNLVDLAKMLSIMFGEDPPLYSKPNSQQSMSRPMAKFGSTSASPANLQSYNSLDGRKPTSSSSSTTTTSSPLGPAGVYAAFGNSLGHNSLGPTTSSTSTSQFYNSLGNSQQLGATSEPYNSLGSAPLRNQYPNLSHLNPMANPRPSQDSSVVHSTAVNSDSFRRTIINALLERAQRDADALKKEKNGDIQRHTDLQSLLQQRNDQSRQTIIQLEYEKEALEHQLQLILTNTDVLETWLFSNRNVKIEFEIDDVYEPTDALSRQLLESSSEDLAVEDTLYALDKALQEGAIQFDVYMKNVRSLAREQFFHRAKARKVKEDQAQGVLNMVANRAGWYNT